MPRGFERVANLLILLAHGRELIGIDDQIPLFLPVIEALVTFDDGAQLEPELIGIFLSRLDRRRGDIKSRDIPALLREPDGVAPEAHPDIESLAGRLALDRFHQPAIGLAAHLGIGIGEDAVPTRGFDFLPVVAELADDAVCRCLALAFSDQFGAVTGKRLGRRHRTGGGAAGCVAPFHKISEVRPERILRNQDKTQKKY